MANLNRLEIIGNVGQEPVMKYTPSGKATTTFAVGTNWVTQSLSGERVQETEWFNIVTWDKLAEQCQQFITKGMQVFAEGRLRTRQYEDNQGIKRTRIEVIAQRVLFLDRRINRSDNNTESELV